MVCVFVSSFVVHFHPQTLTYTWFLTSDHPWIRFLTCGIHLHTRGHQCHQRKAKNRCLLCPTRTRRLTRRLKSSQLIQCLQYTQVIPLPVRLLQYPSQQEPTKRFLVSRCPLLSRGATPPCRLLDRSTARQLPSSRLNFHQLFRKSHWTNEIESQVKLRVVDCRTELEDCVE